MLYKTLLNFPKWMLKNSRYFVALLLVGVSFYMGWLACQKFDANVVTQTVTQTVEVEKTIPIEVPVEVRDDTVIRYIEKITPADADVQITNPAPVISVSYNREKTELTGVKNESQKFENGKLVVEQKSETTLDVTPIVDREVKIATDKAVKDTTTALNEAQDKEMAEERHKRHKREWQSFLAGLGTAGLMMVAF